MLHLTFVRTNRAGGVRPNRPGSMCRKTERLTLSHSRELEDYFAEPHAVISRSGNYVIFGSNAAWGFDRMRERRDPTDSDDLYLIKIH